MCVRIRGIEWENDFGICFSIGNLHEANVEISFENNFRSHIIIGSSVITRILHMEKVFVLACDNCHSIPRLISELRNCEVWLNLRR